MPMKKTFQRYSLVCFLFALSSCSKSDSSSKSLNVIVDYSRVTTDEELRATIAQNVELQQNAEAFFQQARGKWTISNPQAYENVVAGTFNFMSKSEVQTDFTANIPDAGRTRVVENVPYLVSTQETAEGPKTILKKVECESLVKEGDVFYCEAATIVDVEVLRLDAANLDLKDNEATVWNLRR